MAMQWTVKLVIPEHTTYDGILVERQEKEFDIPFRLQEDVWYVHRKNWLRRNSPFVITKSRITGMWATNMIGVSLANNTYIGDTEFDRLFIDKEKAIEYCLKKNEYRKVKIYGE